MMRWLLALLDRRDMRARGGAYLNTMALYGSYRCFHRSHILRLRCLRHWVWDAQCGKHNATCWGGCR